MRAATGQPRPRPSRPSPWAPAARPDRSAPRGIGAGRDGRRGSVTLGPAAGPEGAAWRGHRAWSGRGAGLGHLGPAAEPEGSAWRGTGPDGAAPAGAPDHVGASDTARPTWAAPPRLAARAGEGWGTE